MKLIFLGGAFSKEMEPEILKKSKVTVHYAANKFQWNVIEGLMNTTQINNLEIISAPFIGAYPFAYKQLFIKGFDDYINDNKVKCSYVPFLNLWAYRNISRKKSLIKRLRDFAFEKLPNKTIIIYSPHTPLLEAAVFAKKQDPSIHICLIVPDLPQFMNLNEKKSFIYKKLKEIDIKVFEKNSKYIDSFVLLTKHMKDMLNIGDRPYIVIEGMVNAREFADSNFNQNMNDNKTIVYTGTLNKKFGVVNLVKAFHFLKNDNIRLEICGRGDSENIIKEYAQKDNRIRLWGQLSNDEAVKIQRNATVLVNPRQNNEIFTKYSFPSKNMEYLLSGNPVITYKLDGIPDEYDDYFFYVKDNSIEALTNRISEVLALSNKERCEFGKHAKEFVLNKKNNYEAGLTIINMIKGSRG